jgi:hypothetical protein
MEALVYIWVYLLTGTLPWKSLCEENNDDGYDAVLRIKSSITPGSLCATLPSEFLRYFKKVRELEFEEEPPYAEFRSLFRALFIRLGFAYDYKYDWVREGAERKQQTATRVVLPQTAKQVSPLRPGRRGRAFLVTMEGLSQEEGFPQRRRNRPRLDGCRQWKAAPKITVLWTKPPVSERRPVRLVPIGPRGWGG